MGLKDERPPTTQSFHKFPYDLLILDFVEYGVASLGHILAFDITSDLHDVET